MCVLCVLCVLCVHACARVCFKCSSTHTVAPLPAQIDKVRLRPQLARSVTDAVPLTGPTHGRACPPSATPPRSTMSNMNAGMAFSQFQSVQGPADSRLRHSELEGYQPVSRIGEVVINSFGALGTLKTPLNAQGTRRSLLTPTRVSFAQSTRLSLRSCRMLSSLTSSTARVAPGTLSSSPTSTSGQPCSRA